MLSTMDTATYSQALKSGCKSKPEVDAILMAMHLSLDLIIYSIDESGLSKQEFNFCSRTLPSKKILRLYLGVDGGFDTIYDKASIKTAGICQSIILDVSYEHYYTS